MNDKRPREKDMDDPRNWDPDACIDLLAAILKTRVDRFKSAYRGYLKDVTDVRKYKFMLATKRKLRQPPIELGEDTIRYLEKEVEEAVGFDPRRNPGWTAD